MSDFDSDEIEIDNDKCYNGRFKKTRRRYWNSMEECWLVEYWRRYNHEITTLDVNIPVFRKIMDCMRTQNIYVNSKEVRRTIKKLKKRYFAERLRIENGDNNEDDNNNSWRLYPLIDCIYNNPQEQNIDFFAEQRIVEETINEYVGEEEMDMLPEPNRNYLIPNNHTPKPQKRFRQHHYLLNYNSLLQIQFTTLRLNELRKEVCILAEHCESDLRKLQNEEKEFEYLQHFFKQFQANQQMMLRYLENSNR